MSIDLDEAERVGKAATVGPWVINGCFVDAGDDLICMAPNRSNDGEFIAYARTNWQAMVDELRELRKGNITKSVVRQPFVVDEDE